MVRTVERRRLDRPLRRLGWRRLPQALIRGVQVRRVHLSETAGSLRPQALLRTVAEARRRSEDRAERLAPALMRLVTARREALGRRADRLSLRPIARDIAQKHERLAGVSRRFEDVSQAQLAGLRQRLEALDRLRETLGYKATLERGYAVVRGDGAVVTRKAEAAAASGLEIEFADGRFRIGGTAPKPKGKAKPPEQGSLF